MSGGIKKPSLVTGITGVVLPSLPDKPADRDVVDGRDRNPCAIPSERRASASAAPTQYMIPEIPDRLRSNPIQMLQWNLAELRRRILDDPEAEDLHETFEGYRVRIERTTLSNVLLVEAHVWRKCMKSKNPALAKVALEACRLLIRNENLVMDLKEAVRTSSDLLRVIGQGDLESSRRALVLFQDFLSLFFGNRPDLLRYEASGFRTMAQDRIYRELVEDELDVGEDKLLHLRDLMVVYSQIIFLNVVDLNEIDDGIGWVSRYIKEGHPLEKCATQVRASLGIAREGVEAKKQAFEQGYRVFEMLPLFSEPVQGNDLASMSGEIVTEELDRKESKVPLQSRAKVIIDDSFAEKDSTTKPE